MSEHEFTGKTVESAIEKGLKHLGISNKEADIKILDEGKAGLFGLRGAQSAKVSIRPKQISQEDNGKDTTSAESTAGSLEQEIQSIIKDVASYMDINAQVETGQSDDEILAEIKTDKANIFIGKKGQTINALELILNIIVNKDREDRIRVCLDVEGYRARRENFLIKLANNISQEVITNNRPKDLPPMPAKERRIIHLALKDNPQVQTHSEGEGRYRKVVISPAQKSPTATSS